MRLIGLSLAFILCGALPFIYLWWHLTRWGRTVYLFLDEAHPTAQDLAHYLTQLAQQLDAHPERLRLIIDARNRLHRAVRLEWENELRVWVDGSASQPLSLRNRWIADHPLPLTLSYTTLYIEPVEANRFRVMTTVPFHIPACIYLAGSILVTLGLLFMFFEAVLLVLVLCLACALASFISRRAHTF